MRHTDEASPNSTDHDHGRPLASRLRHAVADVFGTHSHDAADSIDESLEANAEGRRALYLSLGILAFTAVLQALVVDAVLRGETDETVLSRASTLGWHSTGGVVVVVGPAPESESTQAVESVRRTAAAADHRQGRAE